MNIDTTQVLPGLSAERDNKLTPADDKSTSSIDKVSENVTNGAVSNKAVEPHKMVDPNEEAAPAAIDREKLEVMAQKLQDFVGSLNRGLEFSVHDDSGRDVIKVIDKNTGDTVKQYPSEEVLDLVASLSDAAGTFVNMKA